MTGKVYGPRDADAIRSPVRHDRAAPPALPLPPALRLSWRRRGTGTEPAPNLGEVDISTPATRFAAGHSRRIILDLDRLVADGKIAAEEADRLEALGDPIGQKRLFANVLLVFGALMVVAGVLALQPPLEVGLALAVLAIGLGGLLVFRREEEWGLVGQTLALMGVLGVAGWIALRFDGLPAPLPALVWPINTALVLAGALAFRNAVLAAFVPIALASCIGTATGYWHASYALFMQEPALSVLVFGGLASAQFFFRDLIPAPWRFVAVVAARVSFFLANFACWIGSLWGDYPGELWQAPDLAWEQQEAWRQTAVFIPAAAFSVFWALALVAALVAGIRSGRRFVSMTAIVFLAIHFYTQVFELLAEMPFGFVLGGLSLVALGIGLVRFDRWLQGLTAKEA